MAVVAIIPARYASTRFPGKPLALIGGKPMIQHVYENTARTPGLDRVIVATDDRRILDTARNFGAEAMLTSTKSDEYVPGVFFSPAGLFWLNVRQKKSVFLVSIAQDGIPAPR
jgi:GTP:adenosylcobinamide-phosphate guanylyltransferase